MGKEARVPAVSFGVLGPLEVHAGNTTLTVPMGGQRRLLAALLLSPGQVVTVDRLVDSLWNEDPPAGARGALQTYVTRLRHTLAPLGDVVVHRPPGYLLVVPPNSLDADRFQALHRQARAAMESEQPEVSLALLDEALALWRGPAWGELADGVARGEALRLEELRLTATEDRAVVLLDAGKGDEAIGNLERVLAAHPLRERAVALLMDALHRYGRTPDALAAYARHRDLLVEELGLDPSSALVELHRKVLRQEPPDALTPRRAKAPAPASASPPSASTGSASSRSASTARTGPPPLPLHAAGLVGRDDDLRTLAGYLREARLVTVVGPGGVGKTRLVHHLAVSSEEPVWWVDLAPVRDPSAVAQVIGDALGLEAHQGTDPASALARRISDADGLLVLDNCEHLVSTVAHLSADWLAGPGGLRILANSRERLGVEGEQVMVLAPLAVPAPGAIDAGAPAVALFLERAKAVDPDLQVEDPLLRRIGDICRALDGLPLAIELAAARVGTLTVEDLADRLDRRFELLTHGPRTAAGRHRTLRAVVDWSYELLEPDERLVFTRLSVFAARFDLDAAEAVAGGEGVPVASVADVVARLADRSMLIRPGGSGRGRYRMLDTLRQYATGQLSDDEIARLRSRHAAWVVSLAERAEFGLVGPEEAAWASRLEDARGDVRAALRWADETGLTDVLHRVVAALHRWAYWRLRTDLLAWGTRLVERGSVGARRPDVYAAAAAAAWLDGRIEDARTLAERGVADAGGPSSPQAAPALSVLLDALVSAGDLADAVHAAERARAAWHAIEAPTLAAMERANGALALIYAGRPADAEIDAALREARASRNPSILAFARYCEGEALADVEPARAQAALAESLTLAETVGNLLVAGVARTTAVSLRARQGEPDAAAFQLFHEAVAHWRSAGARSLLVTTLRNLVPLLVKVADEGTDAVAAEVTATIDSDPTGKPTFGFEAERLAAALAELRSRMPPEVSASAEAAGRTHTVEQAAGIVLTHLEKLLAGRRSVEG